MTWGSQPRGQIYNNTVFAGKGLKSNPAAFRGGDGFAVRNNIFVVEPRRRNRLPPAAARSRTTATGGPTGTCGWRAMPTWRPGGRRRARRRLDGRDVGFQVDPRFRAPGGGGSIDDAARLGTLRAYDLLPSSPLVGQGLGLAGALQDRAGPLRLPRHALAAGDEVQPRRQPGSPAPPGIGSEADGSRTKWGREHTSAFHIPKSTTTPSISVRLPSLCVTLPPAVAATRTAAAPEGNVSRTLPRAPRSTKSCRTTS